MLLVRKGPTSHLPLHYYYYYYYDNRQTDTTEIPLTEILGRIFNVVPKPYRKWYQETMHFVLQKWTVQEISWQDFWRSHAPRGASSV